MTKLRFKGHTPYCAKSDCVYWGKCTLAATDEKRDEGELEIKLNHSCYIKVETKEESE